MSTAPAQKKGHRPVAVVSFAQTKSVRHESHANEVELLMPVLTEAFAKVGVTHDDLGFICSGSTDYLIGGPFSFVTALDAIGVWPPRSESHVEMDAAWALYEAWVRLQEGDIDIALVYGFGKSSLGDLQKILALQLDPYVVTPLWPGPIDLAALQAQAVIAAGLGSEASFAEIASRNRRRALENPKAQVAYDRTVGELLEEPYFRGILRKHCLPPLSDGASAVILAAGDKAFELVEHPAWITGIDHRIETHAFGARTLVESPSTARAASEAGVGDGPVDVAEVHAPFAHQEPIITSALGLGARVDLNPSGGALAANPLMAGGLIRIGEAAQRILDGTAARTVAHATAGPILQQNLVCVMEASNG